MAHKNKQNRSPWKDRQQRQKDKKPSSLLGQHRRPTERFSFDEADDRIYDIFRHHGFADFPHAQRRQLTQFYFLLMENQQSQNFTRLIKLRDVAIKHFIDSLMLTKICKLTFPLLDIGTGPGFPGIPLKIALPGERIILAEGVQSRVNFLKDVRDRLQLGNLDIIGKFIDEEFVYPVHGVVTRAVEDVSNTLQKSIGCLQLGGRAFLMKGPNVGPEIDQAEKKLGIYYRLAEDIAYELPNTPHQRRLLIYEKIKNAESEPQR